MHIKKCLAILMSVSMMSNLFIASADAPSITEENVKTSISQKSKWSKCKDWIDEHPKTKITLEGLVGLNIISTAVAEVWFHYGDHSIELEEINDNDPIKKQEGLAWCWNACLQRALHKLGIERSQKEIFKGITGKICVSPLAIYRNVGNYASDSREDYNESKNRYNFYERYLCSKLVFNDDIKKYVEQTTNDVYTYQTIYVPWDKLESDIFLYHFCQALRGKVKNVNSCTSDQQVVFLTLFPYVANAHMITIEDYRYDEQIKLPSDFIIGEPMLGKTVYLEYNSYSYCAPGYLVIDDSMRRHHMPQGMPISFIIKKGCQLQTNYVNNLISQAK